MKRMLHISELTPGTVVHDRVFRTAVTVRQLIGPDMYVVEYADGRTATRTRSSLYTGVDQEI